MAYDNNDLVTVVQLKKSAQKASDRVAALEEAINNKLTSVYKIKGSKAFAELTSALLIKANEGNVYNITDAFTTTADFIEGAGKKHTAGSNVVVVEDTAAVYTETADTSVNAEKTYYESRNGGYATVTPAGSAWSGLAPLILMLIAFYFLLIRPQQKRENKRREMINAVKRGDRVITAGGIIGTVHKIIDEREISLEISENVRMRILKNAITEVLKNSSDPVTKTDTEHVKNLKGNAKSSKATGKK